MRTGVKVSLSIISAIGIAAGGFVYAQSQGAAAGAAGGAASGAPVAGGAAVAAPVASVAAAIAAAAARAARGSSNSHAAVAHKGKGKCSPLNPGKGGGVGPSC